MFLKDKYGKKWKLQAAKVLRTGALCVALAGVGTGVMGTLGELGADLGRLGLILPSGWGRWRPMRQSCRITS